MNAMYLIYIPVAVVFVAFVITGGILIPLWQMTESLRERRRPRGPDADVIELHSDTHHDSRVAA